VPDAARFDLPELLAARLGEIFRLILGADHDDLLVAVGAQRPGDVGAERRLPALVRGDELPVKPDLRAIIDRAEVEQQALVRGLLRRRAAETAPPAPRGVPGDRVGEGAAIPDDRVEGDIADPARRRLRREGDDDLAREWGRVVVPARAQPGVVVIVGEAPGAVQFGPARAHELRARVSLGQFQRHECAHRVSLPCDWCPIPATGPRAGCECSLIPALVAGSLAPDRRAPAPNRPPARCSAA